MDAKQISKLLEKSRLYRAKCNKYIEVTKILLENSKELQAEGNYELADYFHRVTQFYINQVNLYNSADDEILGLIEENL